MYYYLIVALQAYCIYHAYKNRSDTFWYFLIFFIPVVGSIIYLVTQVYNKRDAEAIQNEIATIINPSKRVKDLHKRLEFSDTFKNRVDLADAYFEIKDYNSAITHYKSALKDYSDSDFYVYKALIDVYSKVENFEKVVFYSEEIKKHSEFQKSITQFQYGLALDKLGKPDEAEQQMKQIDTRYSNYNERIILAKFLMHRNKNKEAIEIVNEVSIEGEHMNKINKRKYKLAIIEARRLKEELHVSS